MPLASGARLGPYEVLDRLGAGGMGEVYRARDIRLGREVAVKILPVDIAADADRRARFEREARSASALNHPNIVTIFDVGSSPDGIHYIAMERVEGSTLRELLRRGPLPLKSLVDAAAQIADGLARAHAGGIVHRDLKPENIMVNRDGLVKILDFGLAKRLPALEPADSRSPTVSRGDTEAGALLGTVGYMSPEQASGRPADFRSDQFSFGAILYELATGRRAFARETIAETLTAIIREEPEPIGSVRPEVPAPLQWLVERCLAKDPPGRYASTEDLARELKALRDHLPRLTSATQSAAVAHARRRRPLARSRALWSAAAVAAMLLAAAAVWKSRRISTGVASGGPRSIAVLPFQSFGGRAEDDYFLDGMTESIITDLAKVKDLLVIARNSVFQYKGKAVDIRKIGQELGVRYVLEGSVQRSGDRLRLNAQLIDTATGYHLWAERYDRSASDVFAVQDDISRNIAGALRVALGPEPAKPSPPTTNLEAYDAYLRGVYLTRQFDRASAERAIASLERAVTLDPGFSRAQAALGAVYRQMFFRYEPRKEWEEKAHVALQKALSLDPELPEAYLTRGMLTWTLSNGFPHEAAIQDFRRAIAGNPSLGEAHHLLCSVYGHVGLLDEALAECEEARRIDPTLIGARGATGQALLYLHRYEDVLVLHEKHSEFPSGALSTSRAPALIALGRDHEARELAEAALQKEPRDSVLHGVYALLLARAGEKARAQEMIALALELGKGLGHLHHTQYFIGCAYAAMGRKREAVEWLERASAEGFPCYPYFAKDRFLDPLRGDPRFEDWLNGVKRQREHFRRLV